MILLTGGTGYIGSHTLLELLQVGYKVVVLDNLANSSKVSFDRVCDITNKHNSAFFIEGDIRDIKVLERIFTEYDITAVMHFAGLKAVGESVTQPLKYFDNNISGTVTLLQTMLTYGVKQFIFSSSATVYGDPDILPLTEDSPTKIPTNPYGYTKLAIEEILKQTQLVNPNLRVAILRYFNPIGAHQSGKIGEDPNDIPNNLLPYISQVAVGRLSKLSVFGDDYDTIDGTGVRDYIHVVDLAHGHIKALQYLQHHKGLYTWNLGAGQGYSVLQIIKAFEEYNQVQIPYEICPRREGDIAACWANVNKAKKELGWVAQYGLVAMVRDTWYWQKNNPAGYHGMDC